VRRKPGRARYERDLVHRILDEALACHVGFVADGQPYVIPTIHARRGELLYLHGSPASATLGALAEGSPCCVTATLIDGLVLARSARQHSLNYRSVVVLGTAREVLDPAERAAALEAVVEHVAPGRSADARAPSEAELASTRIFSLPLEEASAKVREGPPGRQARRSRARRLGGPGAVGDLAARADRRGERAGRPPRARLRARLALETTAMTGANPRPEPDSSLPPVP
jgi:nitroimidazol reductase NimA-like FMN-containing flavoprotein (pyridoxamine 5'-phosphate oxidase superfamily)